MNINYILKFSISIVILAMINGCGGLKPQVPAHAVAKKQKTIAEITTIKNHTFCVLFENIADSLL